MILISLHVIIYVFFSFIKPENGEKLSRKKMVEFKSMLFNSVILVMSAEGNKTQEKMLTSLNIQ